MAGMTDARITLAEDLQNAGLTVKDHVPAKVVPPLVIIATGDPQLEEVETYNALEFLYRMELFCVVGTATNSAATKAMDEMVEKVIFNLGDWSIERTSAPYMAQSNDSMYLTTKITVTKTIEIQGGQ